MPYIERLTAQQAQAALDQLVDLLQDAVNSGASIGFIPPLDRATAVEYWQKVIEDIEHGPRILLAAREDAGIIGSVQLELATKQNGLHRAEVQKLMVHTSARKRGIGSLLMGEIEREALQAKRTLIVLDTREGDNAERLYPQLGYVRAGVIPQYASSAGGALHGSVFFYKLLPID